MTRILPRKGGSLPDGGTPVDADIVVGVRDADTAGLFNRFSFSAITTYIKSKLGWPGSVAITGGSITGTTIDGVSIKSYVDALASGLADRSTVRAATTANITIATALNSGDTLDGVTLSTGDLVLVKNQSTAAQNGIYVVGTSPARAPLFDAYNEIAGALITVEEGTTNADTMWLCTSNVGGTIDSTAIAFTRVAIGDVAGPGSATDNAVARFDSTTGALIQNSAFLVDDTGNVSSFGGQMAFPASQNASANANTLDDYEEGPFTPVLTFQTPGDLSVAYSVQLGWYTKIGRQVIAQFLVVTSTFTHTTASGNCRITGSPFTSAGNTQSVGALAWHGITKANYTQIIAQLLAGSATIEFACSGSGQTLTNLTAADMPTAGTVILNGSVEFIV